MRLVRSLASQPEKWLWKTYFEKFRNPLGANLPALIPQVYLHYDPYTIAQLKGRKHFQRQRIDFLLLLSDRIWVVLEVDGKHHYATGEVASPKLYSEMVAEDRQLKLRGYEVYRFGGYELQTDESAQMLQAFFLNLFDRHEVFQLPC